MSIFSSAWDHVLSFLARIGAAVFGFASDLLESIAANGGDVLIQAAMDAVLAAEQTGGGGSSKAEAAFNAVVADLQSKGVPVVVNAIKGAIEAAVAKLKAQQASAVVS